MNEIIPPTEEELLKYSGEDEVVSSIDLKKALKEKYKDVPFWKTHIPSLNAMIGGFLGGELTVISGRTGNGKTLYCQSLTKAFADNKDNSLWFTYEVQSLQFLNQFGEDLPHFYMPKTLRSKSLDWIYTKIREAKLKFNINFIFIDHLHFLVDIITRSNPSLEIGKVMRTLKMWSLEFNVAMFLVSHMMKVKADTEPESGDCRDSSFIEQESDNVFYVWRIANMENGAILKITKNRGMGVWNKKIKLIKRGNYLVELSPKPDINDLSDNSLDLDSFDKEE
jgi:replicative DNA helicase